MYKYDASIYIYMLSWIVKTLLIMNSDVLLHKYQSTSINLCSNA